MSVPANTARRRREDRRRLKRTEIRHSWGLKAGVRKYRFTLDHNPPYLVSLGDSFEKPTVFLRNRRFSF